MNGRKISPLRVDATQASPVQVTRRATADGPLETQAFVSVLRLITLGEVDLVVSAVNRFENSRNPFPDRRRWVEQVLGLGGAPAGIDEGVRARALDLERVGVKALDALHASAAEAAGATHFLTCDDWFLNRYNGLVLAVNPVDFVSRFGTRM